MKSKTAIKICGIRTAELALQAALAGADFIGLVFYPPSKRSVSPAQAKAIAAAAKNGGAIPVGVFVHHSATEMQEICQMTGIQTVQLHGSIARTQHHLLPASFQRFYVQTVEASGNIIDDAEGGLIFCDPQRDYVLFDNLLPGSGQPFAWNSFHNSGHFRACIAGGLTAKNVHTVINTLHPAAVDVSSGVEVITGNKSLSLINQFINTVREADHAHC